MAVVGSVNPIEEIQSNLVTTNDRMRMLPKYFGRWMIKAEHTAFSVAERMAERSYSQCNGYWDFFETTNKGFFASPFDFKAEVVMSSPNGSDATVSGEAAGLVVWMMTCSHLSIVAYESDTQDMVNAFGKNLERLQEYAANHKDSAAIFKLLD